MVVQPLNIPPGLYKNGTPYTRRNRWEDANLVRWHDGAVRPIGGWSRRNSGTGSAIPALVSDPLTEAVRDIFSWRNIAQDQNTVLGSNLKLYYLNSAGAVTDITPAGYVASGKDASLQSGYGQNPFGVGAFGVANNLVGTDPIPPNRWYASNFGEVLLTGVRSDGPLYELDLATLTTSVVTNSPADLQDVIVSDERQVVTIGGDSEPRRFQTSDIENRTVWSAQTDNQAVDRTINGNGRLLRLINVLNSILILGENDANVAQYVGPPYVYRISLAGENCGPLASEAVIRTDRFAVWWGERNFWIYDGSVNKLQCEVIDFLYDDLEPTQVSKITAFSNTDYSELWWLYQSNSSTTGEVDSYVMWDYVNKTWQTGKLDRTAGIDKGVLSSVLMINSDGVIYNHELDGVLPMGEGDVFIESGALDLSAGNVNMAVSYIYPDTQEPSDMEFILKGKQMSNATEYTYGPYPYQNEQPIPTRAIGRQLRLRVNFTGANSELGDLRLDVVPSGTGRR